MCGSFGERGAAEGLALDVSLNLWTDVAMLCIFDPKLFEGTKPAELWPPHRNPPVRDGKFVLVGLQGDCLYRLRLTDGALTDREVELANDAIGPVGLEVASGRVYASGMDLPGDATNVYQDHGAGQFVELPPGLYNVMVHELDLQNATDAERAWFPDFVAIINQRTEVFPGLDSDARFSGGLALQKLLKELGVRG